MATVDGRSITHDLIAEVLARVPAKSLMRFKAVSKQWHATICDSKFANLHRSCSQSRSDGNYFITFWYFGHPIAISFEDRDGCTVHNPIEFYLKPTNTKNLITACNTLPLNGLVCFYFHHEGEHEAFVLNLSTRQTVRIANTLLEGQFFAKYYLGFDPVGDEYKLLNVADLHRPADDGPRRYKCEIYTLGTASRRMLADPPAKIWNNQNYVSSATNGAIYWLVYEIGNNSSLIVFDLHKEEFRVVKLLEAVNCKLSDIGGRLALLRFRENAVSGKRFRAWFLEEHEHEHENEVWVTEKIEIRHDLDLDLQDSKLLCFAGISPITGEIVLADRVDKGRRTRNVYVDLQKKTIRDEWFRLTHPRRNKIDRSWLKLRYNLVENVIRLKSCDNDASIHPIE